MNAERALRLQSNHVIEATVSGRAHVCCGGGEQMVPYEPGERAYIRRDSEYERGSVEAVRLSDGVCLGYVNLRNWEAVAGCDKCGGEVREDKLTACGGCDARCCAACYATHLTAPNCAQRGAKYVRHCPVLVFKQPKQQRRSKYERLTAVG